jgi:hypothetical protein
VLATSAQEIDRDVRSELHGWINGRLLGLVCVVALISDNAAISNQTEAADTVYMETKQPRDTRPYDPEDRCSHGATCVDEAPPPLPKVEDVGTPPELGDVWMPP